MSQRNLSEDETIAVTEFADRDEVSMGPFTTPSSVSGPPPQVIVSVPPPAGERGTSSTPGAHFRGPASQASTVMPAGCAEKRQILGGRYELLCLVGSGGMGNVYRARDQELDEVVALKTLRREIADKAGVIDRFRREVRLARRVTHPNVARVFDIGEHGGDKFLTMEYVDGESLSDVITREGPMTLARGVEVAEAICAGLGAAHRAGVIHRDLKPDNVLIAKDGRVVITDFGIARAYDVEGGGSQTAGMTIGTPAYMSPEQVQGRQDIDGRADVYALGAVLYEMFTGERAWRGDGVFAVAAAKLISDPPDPRLRRADLPVAFARLILRCMARAPEARFATVEAIVEELSTLTHLPASGPPSLPTSTPVQGPPAADTAAGDRVVAVLPFRNQGPTDDGYLADELTDDLIDTLSMTRGLKVRPRGVVQRFQGQDQDPREIGRELDVQVVVDGSVRRRAGTVRISARLISVADGFQLWARRLDRPEQEVLRMSDEVAQAIVEALTSDAQVAPLREVPSDPVAIDLYLRGRHLYRQFWPASLREAIGLYDQALARVPGDPMFLAACALARCRLWFFTGEGANQVVESAQRAVRAAPDLAETRLALAAVQLHDCDAPGAVRELKRALSRNPSLAEAQSLLGSILLEAGDMDGGRRWTEAALALDPHTPLARAAMARLHALLGRWDQMEATLAQANPLRSEQWAIRARFLVWQRDIEQGARLMEGLDEDTQIPAMARTLLTLLRDRGLSQQQDRGLPQPPLEIMTGETAHHGPRRRTFMHQLRAEVLGFLGDTEKGLQEIQSAVDSGLIDLLWMERCPLLEGARQDPRFGTMHAVVRRRADAIVEAYRER
ncbi:protein kinase domain-containing protein [Chondromyces crocatus]|uniref:non-specific serine/threonine protein kinase n=1 Tax=Chondromyces crocatus TaxID=52 RepID=A0A0K1EPK3_CHOCO|nr:serine/threonine-protein kinase [Chondromyces crocatus]AKT42786.1 protein kinase [Chondromyces crocatus]